MNIQFYNLKTRQKISVPREMIHKIKYEQRSSRGTRIVYALRAEVNDQKLTKFVSKDDWDKLDVREL